MGKLTRTFLQATRLTLAKTAAYTVTDGAALKAGTSSVKLTTATANTKIAQIYASSSATSGTFYGLYIDVTAVNASGSLLVDAIYVQLNANVNVGGNPGSNVLTAIEAYISLGASFVMTSGWVWGAHITIDMDSAATITNAAVIYAEMNTSMAGTVSYGIALVNNAAEDARACIYAAGKWGYFAWLIGTQASWRTGTGALSVQDGFILVRVNNVDRFIQLYSS